MISLSEHQLQLEYQVLRLSYKSQNSAQCFSNYSILPCIYVSFTAPGYRTSPPQQTAVAPASSNSDNMVAIIGGVIAVVIVLIIAVTTAVTVIVIIIAVILKSRRGEFSPNQK